MSVTADALPEIECPAGTLFVGDLHLDAELGGSGFDSLDSWLERARSAPRVVILGDLFEYWLGPGQSRSAGAERVLSALAGLNASGVAVDLVPGNRDFLLDQGTAERAGSRLRMEGFIAKLPGGQRGLVIHGDQLCTEDLGYLRLRAVLRSRPVRFLAPRLPGLLGRALAGRLRSASRQAVARKADSATAMQPGEALRLMERHSCSLLLCGHAHRFRDEELAPGRRLLVVDAFGGRRDTLAVGPQGQVSPREA